MPPNVLVVDDETSILDTLEILLRGEGFEVQVAESADRALGAMEERDPDVVLTDIRMPGTGGLELLDTLRERDPELPVILMTAQASLRSAVEAVNRGAFYYLQKPFGNDELVALCRRAAESRTLKNENRELKREIRRHDGVDGVEPPIGTCQIFTDAVQLAKRVAPSESTVLITGESGTGKEVIARYIHALSERADGRFISVNCGALPESLLESELFGHVKGSFTGAVKDKEGLLAAAKGGTFFLDEVAEMSPSLQVKLLRALQEREIVPVGATMPVEIDVRVIAATNRDIEHEVRQGAFRTDLYYRLNVISLHLPPLRERKADVPLLAEHFLERARTSGNGDARSFRLNDQALDRLRGYDWPGNVRELENALERAAVLSPDGVITTEMFPDRVVDPPPTPLVSEGPPTNPTLETIERAYILWVLEAEGGNKPRAAQVLGIDPSTLYRKLSRYGLNGA